MSARLRVLAVFARVEDPQHENVSPRELIAHLVLADQHAAHLSRGELAQALANARVRGNPPDARVDVAHG